MFWVSDRTEKIFMLIKDVPSEEGFQNYDFFSLFIFANLDEVCIRRMLGTIYISYKMLKHSFIHTPLGVFKSSCSPLKCEFKLTFDPT